MKYVGLLFLFLLVACGSGFGASFKPAVIPVKIRIGINSKGEATLTVSVSNEVVTPIGVVGVDFNSSFTEDWRDDHGTLTVSVDGTETLFTIDEEDITVTLDSDYYRRVELRKEGNDWYFEVERIPSDPISAFNLAIEDCFNDNGEDEISEMKLVDCSQPHDYEVFALIDYDTPSNDFPGDEELDRFSDEVCINKFESYIGLPYNDSSLYISYLQPTMSSWQNGDREIVCLLTSGNDSKIEGPLRGTRK